MRSKLLQVPHLVLYARNFRAIAYNVKYYSSKGPAAASSVQVATEDIKDAVVKKQIDREVLLLGPKDFRAPFPGNVGLGQNYLNPAMHFAHHSRSAEESKTSDLFESDLPHDRHRKVISTLLNDYETTQTGLLTSTLNEMLECVAQDCPMLLKKDMQDLFPSRDLSVESLTVITLCQKTRNDMSSWSNETDLEREELEACFVTAAQEICESLKEEGYWADFIDPSSGRPFLGPFTNATLFETDARYRHFGIQIEDLGCCKVIRHHLWGTRAFLGSIFTNAALESPQIQGMLERNQVPPK